MAKGRPGRPSFKPTPTLRKTVERMLACGDNQGTIARALGIDEATLRKHFSEELLTGAARRRRQVVDMVFNGAAKGNASLIKRVEEMTRVAVANERFGGQEDAPAQRNEPQGKKEQRQEAAERVGGKFAVPPAPKLVVSNG